jgi:predicted aldo/keto reductase-like oxidoreductase
VAHKFYFFPQNFQKVACVGCGRCVAHCPVNLDLREVLQEVIR